MLNCKYGMLGFYLISISFILYPEVTFAYVDPGIIGTLFQIVYFVVFGFLAALFLKPKEFFKKMFKKLKEKFKSKE